MESINYNTALPFRVTVKMQDGNLNDWYTIYANDLEHAKQRSKTQLEESKKAYGFTIHEIKPLIFNPKLK